jgi:hypothetical protein
MTKFVKENFNTRGEYVSYNMGDTKPDMFIARFKYAKGGKGSFVSFLIKNFTVEEYFSRLNNSESPLSILEDKGYVQPHVKKMLKEAGYPQTLEGRKQYIQNQCSKV